MYELTEEYLTGIQQIDDEHRKLFEIAENLYQTLHDDFIPDKFDHIRHAINELQEYTKVHFAHEEEFMESIGYKRIFTQKTEHDAFIQKLDEMDLDAIDENQEQSILDMLDFLAKWLFHHILENDKKIGEA